MLKSRLPPFFVAVVEEQVHSDRVGLNKRAVLAVTVEVLVGGGADDPRELAHEMHGLSTDQTLVADRADLMSCMFTMDFAFPIFPEASVESTPITDVLTRGRLQVTYGGGGRGGGGREEQAGVPGCFLFAALRWCYRAATELRVFGGLGGGDQHLFQEPL